MSETFIRPVSHCMDDGFVFLRRLEKGSCRINWAVPVFIWGEVDVGSRGALMQNMYQVAGCGLGPLLPFYLTG